MSDMIRLLPAQRPTVSAVGTFAYLDSLRHVPTGEVLLELVPEPDNPHDSRAISIRHRDRVIGYIPRDRTSSYWPTVARVAASGKTAQVKGKIYAHSSGTHYDVSLFLLAGDRSLPGPAGLVPKASSYEVPDAYRAAARPASSGTTFTQAEIEAENRRRRAANPASTGDVSPGAVNAGCAVAAAVAFIAALLIIF